MQVHTFYTHASTFKASLRARAFTVIPIEQEFKESPWFRSSKGADQVLSKTISQVFVNILIKISY